MLAEIAAVCGHLNEAERLLRTALEQAPGFVPLYINLATLLQDLGRTDEAIALLDGLLTQDPSHRVVLSFKAGMLAGARRSAEALNEYERLIACAPKAVDGWTNYADLLKAYGRADDAVAAYRKALALDPGYGQAWWGLASLGTIQLQIDDVDVIRDSLAVPTDDLNRLLLHFALGRALGDGRCYDESFRHYAAANELRSKLIPYDPSHVEEMVRGARSVFTREFLHQRTAATAVAARPIFIVGLPRSGSTLVEQILASHPGVEGLGELFDMERLLLEFTAGSGAGNWLEAVGRSNSDSLRALGDDYLRSAAKYRRTDRPIFTDKMPNNWSYVGLIHLMLPGAKIIDVRRHPLACCFANFALYFNRNTNFASSLEDLGKFYRAYVELMDHFDQALPGRIHHVQYEILVDDLEGEVRRLLEYLDLPFADSCLRFQENQRAVHTPSAAQVRMPLNRRGVDYWRHYEAFLGPLREALGPILGSDQVPPTG